LIPADTIAGRSLVTVIAIMTFLAALAGGCALLIQDASRQWSSLVAREMTIQIKPALGRDVGDDATRAAQIAGATAGVGSVTIFSERESAQLLEPWLGANIDLRDLPVPRLVLLKRAGDSTPDLAGLRAQLSRELPNALLDDHSLWIERLTAMARALVMIAIAIFVLVLASMVLAVSFATRGAMAGSREIIDVLHFVGAEDRFIAREFEWRFLLLGLKGSLIGGLCAIAAFVLLGAVMSRWSASPGGEQVASLFGAFSLGWGGTLVIILIAIAIAFLTALASRMVVLRHISALRER